MKQARIKHMKKSCAASLGMAAVLLTLLGIDESKAETPVLFHRDAATAFAVAQNTTVVGYVSNWRLS
jgi:hypothetical protein